MGEEWRPDERRLSSEEMEELLEILLDDGWSRLGGEALDGPTAPDGRGGPESSAPESSAPGSSARGSRRRAGSRAGQHRKRRRPHSPGGATMAGVGTSPEPGPGGGAAPSPPGTPSSDPATLGRDTVEVVVSHDERATLRVGDVFLKVDTDRARADREAEAMALAPVPTARVLWRHPPVLALGAVQGTALGHLGDPSPASSAAWTAVGAIVRTLHGAPLPPWPGKDQDELAATLAHECEWLVRNDVLPDDVVERNRRLAQAALRPWTPVFVHGDLQVDHVFVAGDTVTGVLDWSEAAPGDALSDLATLTLGHPEHLDAVITGYGRDVDRDLVRSWWALRCLTNVRWLVEHGYGRPEEYPEVALLLRSAV